jgi:hypothetical protein
MSKRYAVHEENGAVVAVVVDGVRYATPDDVPDPDDRARVRLLMAGSPPEVPEPVGRPFPVERVVFLVFAGVAVLMLAVAVITGVVAGRAQARERFAPGRVVALTGRTVEVPRESSDPDGRRGGVAREFFYPVVEFELPDGTRKSVQTAEGSWPPAYEAGEAVTVLYDPERPTDARIASTSGTLLRWTWTLVTGVLGLAFAVAAALVYRVFVRTPRPASSR